MLSTLIESRRLPRPGAAGPAGGAAASIAIHAALIMLAVAVTAHAGEHRSTSQNPPDIFYSVPVMHHPPVPRPGTVSRHPSAPKLPSTPLPPVIIPKTIPGKAPTIDISPLGASGIDFIPGRLDSLSTRGAGPPDGDAARMPYSAAQVDRPAMTLPGNERPRYPAVLEQARASGAVIVQFVVDTSGRVDLSTVRILEASNDLFAASVREVLPQWRFRPASAGERAVKQLVQLPLLFRMP
jgi:TonB family protein